MRSIVSAIALSHKLNSQLSVLWFENDDLSASFEDLFQPIPFFSTINFRRNEQRFKRFFFMGLCKSKRSIAKHLRKIVFQNLLEDLDTNALREKEQIESLRHTKVLISSFAEFFQQDEMKYSSFIPVGDIQKNIEQTARQFDQYTFGVHIRRTDHQKAIHVSGDEIFIEAIKQRLKENSKARFFLATDCPNTQEQFVSRFKDRIIINSKSFGRDSLQGMQSAVIDLYLLSRCCCILGSYGSSFSHTAAKMGHIKEITIQ